MRVHRVGRVPPRVAPDVFWAHAGRVPGLRGRHIGDHVPAGGEQESHAGLLGGHGDGLQGCAAGLHAGQQRRGDGEGRFAGGGRDVLEYSIGVKSIFKNSDFFSWLRNVASL